MQTLISPMKAPEKACTVVKLAGGYWQSPRKPHVLIKIPAIDTNAIPARLDITRNDLLGSLWLAVV
jgi:hypothetical protein